MEIKIFNLTKKTNKNLEEQREEQFFNFINKNNKFDHKIEKTVKEILSEVYSKGDEALIKYSNQFDKTNFKKSQDLQISEKEIINSEKLISQNLKDAIKIAYQRIYNYHKKQLPKDFYFTDKEGVKLGNKWQAIESIGIYIPGGTASYPSSVLMCAIPAIVAKVEEIAICVPTNQGKIDPLVLFAAKICGIKKIYKIGGAQAIAAFTYGTKQIKKVNKIVGPGNSYVAYAKKILFGEVGIDMIAGPTDISIIADNSTKSNWIAADMLSQLEHGIDSKAFAIVDNKNFAQEIAKEIIKLSTKLDRLEIIKKSIRNSAIFVVKDLLEDATNIVNFIAPEHLEIATKNPEKFLPKIKNAGAIFLGNYTPEAIGDYIAGPSHTLPTSACAKFSSGLSVYDFLKRISLISCNQTSFTKLAIPTSLFANAEGLDAHKLSIEIRKK
jgi:histidinol dehydrogenase